MTYKWKEGSHHKVPAQIAGEVCEELEERGELTAQNLVDVSRPEDAPLHNEFEWDDEVAAELYRETQAGQIIRHLAIRTESIAPVRAYAIVEVGSKTYESIQTVIRNEEKYASLLNIALKELGAFKRKYQMLSELQEIFDAIEKAACAATQTAADTSQQKGQGENNTNE